MQKNILCLWLIILLGVNFCTAQRNNIWCFGDSAGIDFNIAGSASPISTAIRSRGSCVSVADESGSLLFYAGDRAGFPGDYSTLVFNNLHDVMPNGDSILGQAWYQELVIIPNPVNDSTYYLFSVGVTGTFGLSYSLIDMRMNGGLGDVVIKNVFLQSFEQTDCIKAIKHGNGRDWWLFYRKSDFSTGNSNNDWYKYLITPYGILTMPTQDIGQQNRTNLGHICFSPNGNKLVFSNLLNVIDLFDFDRCSGILSNQISIETDPGNGPYPWQWSTAFSPDESKLYVSTGQDTSFLFQYDLSVPNIPASKDTLWSTNFPPNAGGALKLAPDNKIYFSCWYSNGFNSPYPYPDSVYNLYNMNLSVINQPNNLGVACDFQSYSFSLNGKRTYLGLPNNPDYEMGPLIGSPCDTLVGTNEITPIPDTEFFVNYASNWQMLYVNGQKVKGRNYRLRVVDILGKELFFENGLLNSSYYTKSLNCQTFAAGMYIVTFETEKERLVKRFVIQ